MFFLPMNRRRLLADARLLGRWGERRSERFLKNRGLKTIARNFNCKLGEIDLIVTNVDGMIVFVEVKAVATNNFGAPEYKVTPKKQKRLAVGANAYLSQCCDTNTECRFDVITISFMKRPPEINHIKNAFYISDSE